MRKHMERFARFKDVMCLQCGKTYRVTNDTESNLKKCFVCPHCDGKGHITIIPVSKSEVES